MKLLSPKEIAAAKKLKGVVTTSALRAVLNVTYGRAEALLRAAGFKKAKNQKVKPRVWTR